MTYFLDITDVVFSRRSTELLESPSTLHRSRYPNPGYLGPSSHIDIFDHILSEQDSDRNSFFPLPSVSVSLDEHPSAKQGALLTRELLSSFALNDLISLVTFWRAKGVNLAVAEPFVDLCAESFNYMSLSTFQGSEWHLNFSTRLLQNTAQPLEINPDSTMSTFSAQFLGINTRWETFGIFLSAAIQATRDVLFFPSLYITSSRNQELRRLLTRLLDCSLDICLSADCLNDLQLILQYENFIVHSYVDGDQSYHYWRTLGDVIASVFALGYHENIDKKAGMPEFLKDLRKTVFARSYSADKNVSIFLGRPLRMSKRFCHFQIPSCHPRDTDTSSTNKQEGNDDWKSDACLSYRAETRWSALCASIKEEILELLFDRSRPRCLERTSALQTRADAHWEALPTHFRFEGSLKRSNLSPFERDFVVSIRLNYLHISFLLERLLLRCLAEPNEAIIDVAQQMLHLVVEAILLREELSNSGTGLDWKIAYYGLPSAGILLLAILRQQRVSHCPRVVKAKVLEDLTVLAAEVGRGTVVRSEEPNYALLFKATQTIQRFLDYIHSEESTNVAAQQQASFQSSDNDWLAQWDHEPRDFDIDFWQGLVDDPSLFNLNF
ncbi:hypothetical protein N431DRAFT_480455 [Stipitochalara longipes BDJ]|nr:hypothetical protein N431DRAFT_480455 [Stipitochalara longipes BDJ]